jgi:hypothetical protein
VKRFLVLAALMLAPGAAPAAENTQQSAPARLLGFTKDVMYRRSGAADWLQVRLNMDLFGGDTLYTRAGSRAVVRFYTGETLGLTPNSLVVLRPPGRKDTGVEMVAGELLSRRARVITRTATILPATPDAEFSAKVTPDRTTTVKVTRGTAEVEAQGKRVLVHTGFVTEVRPDMPPSTPVKAPPPEVPDAGAAAPREASPAATLPPGALDSVEAVSAYQLQVAMDKDFKGLLVDRIYDVTENPDLSALLAPGEYFFRIAKIDLLGYKGKFCAPKPLKVPSD